MKSETIIVFLSYLLAASAAFAGGEHSHGPSGELEHALPVIGILVGIAIIGGIFFLASKKKG